MDLFIVEHLKMTFITTMINSINVKELPYEKMDCKITTNGLLWLRSGKFTSRFDSKKTVRPIQITDSEKRARRQYREINNKMLNEPEYFSRNVFEYRDKQRIIEAKSKPKNRQYQINKRQVRARLYNFLNTDKGAKELYFYTITFPVSISYDSAYRILNSTLTSIRSRIKEFNYLWIAEKQKNGTIHFHIASFKFIKVRIVNELVKKSIKNEIRNGHLDWSIHNANRYNGVDIGKNRDTRVAINFAQQEKANAISKYITKYISKSKEKFPRKAWSCSNDLAIIATSIRVSTSEAVVAFDELIDWNNCIFSNEFCEFYPWLKAPPNLLDELMKSENNKRLNTVL